MEECNPYGKLNIDSFPMDAEEYKELHEAIEKGDFERVTLLIPNNAAGKDYSYDDMSALYNAYLSEEYEIAAYLLYRGAEFGNDEQQCLKDMEIDLTRLNYLLLEFNKKSEKSCIYQIMSWSQSPQGLDGECHNAVMSMYNDFFESQIMKLLMSVLESEKFDMVYNFCSDDVNRSYRPYNEDALIYGLTLTSSKQIFVGSKNLLSADSNKKSKVYGVVAEEFCHMALTTLFENDAKPYRKEDSELTKKFQDIVSAVKSLLNRSCHIESVIKDVYTNYPENQWEWELIARVPHVIGIYGEEFGRRIFLELPELFKLLSFYEENVIPKCKEYTDPSHNTKPQQIMEHLMKNNAFLSFKEKQTRPLKEDFLSFREFLVNKDSFAVITTNCTRLCTLHVYHELKREFKDLLLKKCIFFTRKCFDEKRDEILNVLKGKVWKYLILILDEVELNIQRLEVEYTDHLDEVTTKGMKLIIISGLQSLGEEFQSKKVKYKWNDLSEGYKELHQSINYIFKGQEKNIYIGKDNFPIVFTEDEIIKIISGNIFVLTDGPDLDSDGYIPATYIDRKFQATSLDIKIFKNLPPDTRIFIYGLFRQDFQQLSIDEKVVQWLKGADDKIQEGKSVFISSNKRAITFEEYVRKTPTKNNICLFHDKKVFYLGSYNSSENVVKQHIKQITYTEEDLIYLMKRNKVLIISDNAGCGKSTAISSLIKCVQKNIDDSLIFRIDLNKFSTNEKDPLSLANIEEDDDERGIFGHLYLMLGLKNHLEKYHFTELSKRGNCFIFFDAFDEVPSKYQKKAETLISTLSKKSNANIIVASRKHHKEGLEKLLNTFSLEMVPFSYADQVTYLTNFWRFKFKYPHGEGAREYEKDKRAVPKKIKKIIEVSKRGDAKLDLLHQELILELEKIDLEKNLTMVRSELEKLNFTPLAKDILGKNSLDRESLEFMGIPLHLFMIGSLCFDGNFNLKIQSDFYFLYSKFFDQKVLIYVEEKQGLWHDGREKEYIVKMRRKDAFKIHIKLANRLFDEGRICIDSEMDEEDLELCSALGIVCVQGEVLNFLHHTFAEYFKAEGLMKEMKEKDLIEMLLDDKYFVVRRFLSSALSEEAFLNLTRKFSKDVDFIVNILERVADKCRDILIHESNSDICWVFKIVKIFLKNFEEIAEEDLMNEFIDKLDSTLPKHMNRIGGCITINIIKKLLTRNFNKNSILILCFLRFSNNLEEIINVIKECISIIRDSECGLGQEESWGGKKRQCYVNLLKIRDECINGLIFHAIYNERADIYANLLKFFRDELGKEQLTIRNENDRQMNEFIATEHPNRICILLKALYSVFENDVNIFFNNSLKVSIILKAIQNDESSNTFENVVHSFKECFGVQDLREFLSKDLKDKSIIQMLIYWYSDRNFLKNLNLINNILDDNEKMKKILKSKDRNSKNMFHYAAFKCDTCMKELVKFCDEILGKGEVMDMLLSVDECGNNVIHELFLCNSTETLRKNLKVLMDYSCDGEMLKKEGRNSMNIIHCAAEKKDMCIDKILLFCHEHLGKSGVVDMLLSADEFNDKVIHYLAKNNLLETLMQNLEAIKEYLGDDEAFNNILKSKGRRSMNLFHYAAEKKDAFIDKLLEFCGQNLGKAVVVDMLKSADEFNDQVIHYLVKNNLSESLMKNLEAIDKYLGDDETFKNILKSKGRNSMNLFHYAAENGICVSFLSSYLSEIEIAPLLKERSDHGITCLYLLVNNLRNMHIWLDYAGKIFNFDKSHLEELLLVENFSGNTFLHVFVMYIWNYGEIDLLSETLISLREKLSGDQFKKLLRVRNREGETFLQIQNGKINQIIACCKEILEKDMFEELLKTKEDIEGDSL